ncbi:MAG: sulfotransferase family protein, partial [Limisphaerales bacterium]
MRLRQKRNDLNAEQLYAMAQRQTRLQDFGDPQICLRLAVLVASIERESNLHGVGRFLMRNYLCQLLKTRLVLEHSWKTARPIKNGAINSPIFITGIPRSGSTFLHELMAGDEGNRTLAAWELLEPIGRSVALRKLRTAMSLWVFRRLARGADAVHPLRANSPHECVSLHSYSLLSREFGTMLRVPTYDAFLDQIDFTPAYVWQKRFLERAQSEGPARRWVLKAPDHSYALDALFKVFPDAMVIQTHREPMQVVKSATRMVCVVRKAFSNDVDVEQIAHGEAEALQQKISRITHFREHRPDIENRFIDVTYTKLSADPLKTVRQIYDKLGLPFSEQAQRNVSQLAGQSGRYSQKGLTRQLRETKAEELVDAGQF